MTPKHQRALHVIRTESASGLGYWSGLAQALQTLFRGGKIGYQFPTASSGTGRRACSCWENYSRW